MEDISEETDYSLCLICGSSFITAQVKVEPDLDQSDDDGDCQSVIKFVLAIVLEIPQNEVVKHLGEKLINKQLTTFYCEMCTNLVYSAKQIYIEILELSRRFRNVQKQIVEQISNYGRDHRCGTTVSTSNQHHDVMEFCRKFLNKKDFNGFGYPFIVNDNPVKTCFPYLSSPRSRSTKFAEEDPGVDQEIKEEPISENEDGDGDDSDIDNCGSGDNDEDNPKSSSDSSVNEDSQSESDSDLEPPPPKKPVKKVQVPIKKSRPSSSSVKKVGNRKSPKQRKPQITTRLTKFAQLYPNYPARLKDPTTNKFHCGEPFCSKNYPRKAMLERHIIIEHLQDNFYKCGEPNCGKSYASGEHFEDHVSWHKGIPRWKCQEKVTTPGGKIEQCTEAFFVRRKLTRHVQKVHEKDKPFICEICGKSYSCSDYLTSHKYEKHSEKEKPTVSKSATVVGGGSRSTGIEICNYCGKTFKIRTNLETHINLVHEKTIGKFECQFCEHRFRMKFVLKQHLWSEHQFSLEGYRPPIRKTLVKEYGYQCEVKGCRKLFKKEASLKRHMEEKHGGGGGGKEGVFGFHCKYCGKGFHLKGKLEHHQRAHENKESKPFGCEICGNGFATVPYLKMHRWNIHKIPMEKARKNKEGNKS